MASNVERLLSEQRLADKIAIVIEGFADVRCSIKQHTLPSGAERLRIVVGGQPFNITVKKANQ